MENEKSLEIQIKPITVWKVLKKGKRKNKAFPFYQRGKSIVFDKKLKGTSFPACFSQLNTKRGGFYSFKFRKDALEFLKTMKSWAPKREVVLVKCTIPPRTWFVRGKETLRSNLSGARPDGFRSEYIFIQNPF
jgi:hypothetical protein